MQLRKLEREYQRCLESDFSQKLEEYSTDTPLIDALKKEAQEMRENKESESSSNEEIGEDGYQALEDLPEEGNKFEQIINPVQAETNERPYPIQEQNPVILNKGKITKQKITKVPESIELKSLELKPPEWAKE